MRVRRAGELQESAAAVKERVDLRDVVLSHADFRAQPRSATASRIRCKVSLQIASRVDDGGVECWSRYELIAHEFEGDDERGIAWRLDLEALARYEVSGDVDFGEDQLEAFAVVEGASTIHPYATAWTQMYTSQSVFPAFTLGTITPLGDGNPDTEVEFPDDETEAE